MARLLDMVDEAWDVEDPAGSEARFRDLLVGRSGRDADVLTTQLARAIGLQGRYDEALDLLDGVAASKNYEVQVRMLLEQGRVLRSSGATAPEVFDEAAGMAQEHGLQELRVDALHMWALVGEAGERLPRTEAALSEARTATDVRARNWDASLLNNLGIARQDAGDLAGALEAFEEALAARERIGRPRETRVARWMVGWMLRLLGRTDAALAVQEALAVELAAAGETDPHVEEELLLLRGPGPVSET